MPPLLPPAATFCGLLPPDISTCPDRPTNDTLLYSSTNPTPTAAMLARPLTLSRPRRCRLAFVPHRTSFCAVRHARPISSFSVGSEPAVSRPPEQESLPPRGLASGQYQAPQMHPYRCIVGSPGTGATPNWGRRNRIDSLPPFMSPGCFEPDRTERPLMATAKQQAERQQGSSYVHQVCIPRFSSLSNSMTERPADCRTYPSTPLPPGLSALVINICTSHPLPLVMCPQPVVTVSSRPARPRITNARRSY